MKLPGRSLMLRNNEFWLDNNGFAFTNVLDMNQLLVPVELNEAALGDNWINPESLGPAGVGDLSVLDNRHISTPLKALLCDDSDGALYRDYLDALIGLAWPSDTVFQLCCAQAAGRDTNAPCQDPDFVFQSTVDDDGGGASSVEPPTLAPHFLTQGFGLEQQMVLTAAVIAKINTNGRALMMEIAGRLDLGEPVGTRFHPREHSEEFPHELGQAWGNMFLNCAKDVGVSDLWMCRASLENDREIGRDPAYQPYPMFTCSGTIGNYYPLEEAGMSCFSKDMETNTKNGCGLVASAGSCDKVCLGGFCGVNQPPVEGHGTTNVVYVYMSDYHHADSMPTWAAIFFPVMAAFLLLFVASEYHQYLQKQRKQQQQRCDQPNVIEKNDILYATGGSDTSSDVEEAIGET